MEQSKIRQMIEDRLASVTPVGKIQIRITLPEDKVNQITEIAKIMSKGKRGAVTRNMLIADAIEAYCAEAAKFDLGIKS